MTSNKRQKSIATLCAAALFSAMSIGAQATALPTGCIAWQASNTHCPVYGYCKEGATVVGNHSQLISWCGRGPLVQVTDPSNPARKYACFNPNNDGHWVQQGDKFTCQAPTVFVGDNE